jgi:hypothetical protein
VSQDIPGLIRDALTRVFTVELHRATRIRVLGEPVVREFPSYKYPGRTYVTVSFEMEQPA